MKKLIIIMSLVISMFGNETLENYKAEVYQNVYIFKRFIQFYNESLNIPLYEYDELMKNINEATSFIELDYYTLIFLDYKRNLVDELQNQTKINK